VTGTQDGEYRSIPAMHKKITVQGVSINKIIDGKLAETRMLRDDLGLMRQLGVIPE
jgi:predicted ester cyclase